MSRVEIVQLASHIAGTLAVAFASHRALVRWQAISSLEPPPHGASTSPSRSSPPHGATIIGVLVGQAGFFWYRGVLPNWRAAWLFVVVTYLVVTVYRDASMALYPPPRLVRLVHSPAGRTAQISQTSPQSPVGSYELDFTDPPEVSTRRFGQRSRLVLAGICTSITMICAARNRIECVPFLLSAAVLFILPHAIVSRVTMKGVVGIQVGVVVVTMLEQAYRRSGTRAVFLPTPYESDMDHSPDIVYHRYLYLTSMVMFGSLNYMIPGLFILLQHRYEHSLRPASTRTRTSTDPLNRPGAGQAVLLPPIHLALHPTFILCLLGLLISTYTQAHADVDVASTKWYTAFNGKPVGCVVVVVVAAVSAGLNGRLREWWEYEEVWIPAVRALQKEQTEHSAVR